MYVDISSDWLFFLTKLFTSDFKLFPGESLFSLSFKADDSADSGPSTYCEDIFVHFFVHFFASTVSSYCYFCCKCNHVYKRYINFIINIQNYIYKLNVNNKLTTLIDCQVAVCWIKIVHEADFTVIKVNKMISSISKCFLQVGSLGILKENFLRTKILMKGSGVTSSEFHGFKIRLYGYKLMCDVM